MSLRRRNLVLVLLVTTILICGATDSTFQDVQAGEFDFSSSITLKETYDDNIDLEGKNEESDFITSLIPSFSISYLTESTSLSTTYSPQLQFYAKNTDRNDEDLDINPNGTLNFNTSLTRTLSVTITDSLVFLPAENITDRKPGGRNYPSDQLNNTFNSVLLYRLFEPTSLRLGFSHSLVEYEMSGLEDTYEYSSNVGLDQQLTTRDILSLDYFYRRLFTDGKREADVQSIRIGERHQFPRDLLLTLSGGLELINEQDRENYTEWSASVGLNKNFRRGNIGIAYNRSISVTEGAEGTSVDQILSLTGGRSFTKRLRGNGTCYFSTEESVSGDEVDSYDAGLVLGSHYEVSKKLSGSVDCSFVYHDSRVSPEDTITYRATIGATYLCRSWCRTFLSYSYYQQDALYYHFVEDIENNIITLGIEMTWL